MRRRARVLLILFLLFLPFLKVNAGSDKGMFIIPIKGDVGPAMSSFVEEKLKEARNAEYEIVILEIDTYGGVITDAVKIRDYVKDYSQYFKIYSYVNNKAESAGVLLTLSCEKIYMAGDASIGSASVIPYDEKTNSAWAGILKAQAEYYKRDGRIAQGMADKDLEIPNLKDKGKLINLSASDAKKLGFCDEIVNNVNDLKNISGYRGQRVIYADKSFKIRLTEFIGNPYISSLLLLVGFVALIIEAFIPSFGIAGTIGLASIALYFMGNIFAGNTGWWTLILFVIGVVFLAIEMTVPGFGAPGITGIISMGVAIALSAGDLQTGLILLLGVIVISVITVYILFKYGMSSKIFSKVILKTEQKTELGYIVKELKSLVGKEGITESKLRPSGVAKIEDSRYDVIAEGEFIERNKRIYVQRVEGNKIIVKKREED